MKSKVFGCRIPLAPDKIMTLSYSSEKIFEALRYIEECVEKGILVVFSSVNYTHYSVYEFIGINEITIKTDGSDIENIPFKETNMYVRKIIKNYEIYKKLYN